MKKSKKKWMTAALAAIMGLCFTGYSVYASEGLHSGYIEESIESEPIGTLSDYGKSLPDGSTLIEEPDDLVSSYGQTLGSIVLPEGWTWEDPDLVLNETIPWFGIGYNSFAARFDVSQYENQYDFTNVQGYQEEQHCVVRDLEVFVSMADSTISFKEYVESTGSESELARKYVDYLENSSFPYTLELAGQPKEIRDYLDGLFNTIVVKDISQRKKINDAMMLRSVLRFLFDNIGNPLSSKKIADTMTSDGRKIDVKTVEKYIEALMESYVIYQANRYNVKGKQYLKTLEKYYVVDIGMRYMLLGFRSTDVGHILENVIYLELLRRGLEVYVGKVDEFEVDFVAMDGKRITYYQVAATVRDENTLKRELAPLQKIADHYPKVILTLDDDPEADYEGIRRVNALDWLMGKIE